MATFYLMTNIVQTSLQTVMVIVSTNLARVGSSSDTSGRPYDTLRSYVTTNQVSRMESPDGSQTVEHVWKTDNGPTNGAYWFRPILSSGLFPTNTTAEPVPELTTIPPTVRDTADRGLK